MWDEIDRRIAENEADHDLPSAPLRGGFRAQLEKLNLTPIHATKKMSSFNLANGTRVLWELTSPSVNFFVSAQFEKSLEAEAFALVRKPFIPSKSITGGRHSALSAKWGFGNEDCVCVKLQAPIDFDRFVAVLSGSPKAIATESLSRAQIEAAMDAFDDYRKTGAHSDVFVDFRNPDTYWVRSSRERENRVYPTKPLVSFILKGKELSGGWSRPTGAAARLHNAGFIIVDQNDHPIDRLDRYAYLIDGADRIRLCALNYFVEPARELAASEVSIHASDVATALGLKNDFPNICQALGREKFQKLADVPPPNVTGPNPSSTTVFTFTLISHPETATVTDNKISLSTPPENLILYGPPGTGKTYRTAYEAVRICLGSMVAGELSAPGRRSELMVRYRELVSDGRIDFVTFHQSMSYEEFVEGLRPTTGEENVEVEEKSSENDGFRLRVEDGIFKRISEAARLDVGANGQIPHLDRKKAVYYLSLDRNIDDLFKVSIDSNRIFLGVAQGIDWSSSEFEDREAVEKAWQDAHPSAGKRCKDIEGAYFFRGVAENGDYVVLPQGLNRILAFGKIVGDYEFDPQAKGAQHSRRVEWIWHDENGAERSGFFSIKFSSRAPMYRLKSHHIDWDALEEIVFENKGSSVLEAGDLSNGIQNYVLIIDEINRANISKVFGELITLLEPDKRLGADNEIRLKLPYSKKKFGVPTNLHIIGTMNTADRSIALLDTALRRRFAFKELMPDPSVLPTDVDGISLQMLLRTLNDRIEYLFDREHQIGHAYFTGCKSRDEIEVVMRDRVIPLLAEYFYEDWAKVAAVLGDSAGGVSHFLEARAITPPSGLVVDEFSEQKNRWTVKDQFDFSEFEA